jgi:hypothetical protein
VKYERFEDLPVWIAAIDFAQRVYLLTRDRLFSQSGDLRDQLRRAALSISNNIAEEFELELEEIVRRGRSQDPSERPEEK